MQRNWTGRRLWTAALVGLTAGLAAAQTVTLKPKYEAGKTTYVEHHASTTQAISGGPMGEMKFVIDNVVGMLMKVDSADDKGSKLTLTYERVMTSSNTPMMSGTYDSDVPNEDESPELAEMFKPMLGGKITAELDKDGKAKSVTGMEAVVKKVEDSAGGNQMFEQMKRNMTDDEMKRQWIEAGTMLLPDKPVKVGDTWTATDSHESPFLGTMTTKYDCKLDKIAKDGGRELAYVSYTAKIPATEPKPHPMGGNINIDSGEAKGTATFDVKTGQAVSSNGETKLNLKLEAKQGEQAMTMKIDVTSTETSTTMTEAERAKSKEENKKKAEAAAKEAAAKSKSASEKKATEEKPKKDPG